MTVDYRSLSTMEPPKDLTLWQLAGWYFLAWFSGCIGSCAGALADHQNRELTRKILLRYLVCGTAVSIAVAAFMDWKYGFSPLLITICIFASFKAVDVLMAGAKLFKKRLE